jgi:hypothetical protein
MDSSFDDENDDSGDYARLVSTRDEDLLRDWKIGVVSQAALNNMLEEDERVVEARPRSWWYAHRMFFGISLLGTIVFLGLLIWQLASRTMSKYFYYFLMMAMFPILFLGAVLQAMRARKHETWVAVTTKRVLLFSDVDTVLAVKLANILSWRPWINWLMWSREIELKVKKKKKEKKRKSTTNRLILSHRLVLSKCSM